MISLCDREGEDYEREHPSTSEEELPVMENFPTIVDVPPQVYKEEGQHLLEQHLQNFQEKAVDGVSDLSDLAKQRWSRFEKALTALAGRISEAGAKTYESQVEALRKDSPRWAVQPR